jgi:hypothetical protein
MQFFRRKGQKVHYSAVFGSEKRRKKAFNAEAQRKTETRIIEQKPQGESRSLEARDDTLFGWAGNLENASWIHPLSPLFA